MSKKSVLTERLFTIAAGRALEAYLQTLIDLSKEHDIDLTAELSSGSDKTMNHTTRSIASIPGKGEFSVEQRWDFSDHPAVLALTKQAIEANK